MRLLRLRKVSVSFPSRGGILNNVSLSIEEGELILLTGPSGSGKTTLLRVIASIIPYVMKGNVTGSIEPQPAKLVKEGLIAYVPQEPWYSILTPYVWSEITSFTNIGINNVKESLTNYGLAGFENRTTFTLSAGELQRLNFIIAENSRKRLILLDEPTSHLDRLNTEKVVRGIARLKREGKTMLIVDHRVELWRALVDRVFYVSNGLLKEMDKFHDPYKDVKKLIRGLKRKSLNKYGDAVCEVNIKEFKYAGSKRVILKDLSFKVFRGEVILIKGVSGSGKTTLLKLIASNVRSSKVNISIHGKVFYIPDNPLLYFSAPTPLEEVGIKNKYILRDFNVDHVATQPILRLSSGERRRVALASAFVRGADLILLDEPTVGLDPLSKYVVMKYIVKLAEKGVSFIIASHDEDLEVVSDEVMKLGEYE